MTRFYKKRKMEKYTKDQLNEAIMKIQNEQTTIKQAATEYNIPKSTLYSHISGRSNTYTPGRPTLLSIFEERSICDAVLYLSDAGMAVDNNGLKDIVARFCHQLGRNAFNNETPSNDWIYAFIERWKSVLNKRMPQNVNVLRAKAINQDVLNQFYDLLHSKIDSLKLSNKPGSIFNCDETGFMCAKGKKKVFCRRGETPLALTSINDKLMYTVNVRRNYLKLFENLALIKTFFKLNALRCVVALKVYFYRYMSFIKVLY